MAEPYEDEDSWLGTDNSQPAQDDEDEDSGQAEEHTCPLCWLFD